ncbi:conserved oligomeric Golgi complex subunit 3 isoform X1 [Dermacentor silvarum]|uniref:conserved oligomeric Golgi complex subunit 3 isoform X1 n=2 Tax=Dermacentor silvarum TaxID=543639 RepID=UPI00189C3679|nr:conserved oligomeric Golgi complex subunit 3 isoform X1 [Dermacentor silvarum]
MVAVMHTCGNMASAMHVNMKEIKDNLENWEHPSEPLAPITDKQAEGISQLMAHVTERPMPVGMPPKLSMTPDHKRKAMPLVPELSELPECLQNVVKGDVVITNAQQFLTWFSEVEEKMMEESDWEYTNYIDVVASYREKCCEVLCEIDASMAQLRLLQGEYEFVSNKTNALHEACEHLLDEQSKLMNAVETIAEKLRYFTELDTLSQKMASPDISVLSESFIPMLTRLDECIGYLESNPQYKEAGTYLVKFKHMQWQALEMIRSYVTSTLEHTTHQVLSRKDPLCSTDNSFALLYGKFRTHAPRIHSLVGQIEERVERNAEYRELLDACHTCYFGQRETLLGPSVSTAMKELAAAHQRDHCSLVRSGCAFLVHLCEDEHQLYMQFFTKASSLLDDFLSHLCERLYDVFRPIIIHINHLETLAELCSILKVEMMEQHVAANPNELRAFCKIAQQMLEDVQERLVYRTLVYVRTDILGYNPAPGDLAYPEKLEMMESIAESLAQNSLSRSSSRGSLVSIGSSASGSLPHLQSSIQSGERPNEVAVLQVSSAQHITETTGGSTTTHTTISAQNSDAVPSTRHKGYSPADLHGMWYPTVRRTLVCLSKLYRCVDKTIFQGLSQEVLAACIDSLSTAGKEISKNKATLDGELFQIKHLLILREQIAPFQIDFAIKETSLDFTRIRDAALSLYSKKSRLFSLGTNNALLQFVLEGSLSMKENLIDSKKAVDNQLKALCEEFIANSARMLVGPLQDFLDKANLILQVKEQEPTRTVSLRNQPFAAPDSVGTVASSAYRHLKSSLTALGRSMTLYLANKDTEQILFKPIKTRVLVAYENFNRIVKSSYSEEDQQIIACPSVEQINVVLTAFQTK